MDAQLFSTRYDHTLVYAKNRASVCINQIATDEIPKQYNKTEIDGHRYYLKPLRAMNKDGSMQNLVGFWRPESVVAPQPIFC